MLVWRPWKPSTSSGRVTRTLSMLRQRREVDDVTGRPALVTKVQDGRRAHEERRNRLRHLLRAILRECTCLPDAFVRRWTAQHALSRFRTYSFKVWKHRDDESFERRLVKAESEARNALSVLQRANAGQLNRMRKVFLMAYGRTGKRRHELMRPLLEIQSETPSHEPDDHEVELHLDDVNEVEERGRDVAKANVPPPASKDAVLYAFGDMVEHDLGLSPQLLALVKSQIRAAPESSTRRNPKRIKAFVPALNSWHRPMPKCRVKNMLKQQYATLLERTLPPLPEHEWERLRGLATGDTDLEVTPARRKSVATSVGSSEAGKPQTALEIAVMYGKAPASTFDRPNYVLCARAMRRLYAAIFKQCPLLELDHERDAWKVTWGSKVLHEPMPTTPSTDN